MAPRTARSQQWNLAMSGNNKLTFDLPTHLPKLTLNLIRSSRGHSTPSLKILCKSVQPFSRNLADKERKKQTNKEIDRKQYPAGNHRPWPGRGLSLPPTVCASSSILKQSCLKTRASSLIFTVGSVAYCHGKLSVCPSVRLWRWSHALEFFENKFTDISLGTWLSADPNITDLLQREHPKF